MVLAQNFAGAIGVRGFGVGKLGEATLIFRHVATSRRGA